MKDYQKKEANMITTIYKLISLGDKFEYEGITYTKYNHGRSYYYDGSKKILRNFKNKTNIKTEKYFHDIQSSKV